MTFQCSIRFQSYVHISMYCLATNTNRLYIYMYFIQSCIIVLLKTYSHIHCVCVYSHLLHFMYLRVCFYYSRIKFSFWKNSFEKRCSLNFIVDFFFSLFSHLLLTLCVALLLERNLKLD